MLFAVGSDADIEAAGVAFGEAVRRGARLRFVCAAHYRPSAAAAPYSTAPAAAAEYPADAAVGDDHDRFAPAPDSELITATAGADVLVIARSRHGGRGARHTRTLHMLLHHAHCPVLVVPGGPTVSE
ncbi:universal stress protein [Streptomyces sp. IB2014 016-6]|uniref:universal stress protein n=1 Tax=Streptomyces sp. IB2014 016-6 TaxID=2517818 RepID=UPI0011C85F2B|nr:universal stress protein [Streptomyces sp. IB2014 016-6]TXL89324.1 universal stress protein [Streptomyces sp. IB2014 016-6]